MPKVITVDEMCTILKNERHERADEFRFRLRTLAEDLAAEVSGGADCTCSWPLDGDWELGTSVCFYPKHHGDPVPETLQDYDREGDWTPLVTPTTVKP